MANSTSNEPEDAKAFMLRQIDRLKPSKRAEIHRVKNKLKEQCGSVRSKEIVAYAVALLAAELRGEIKD